MPNPALAQLYADNLAGLVHPSGKPIRMPGFATATPGLPTEIAEAVAQNNRHVGDALVHVAETAGWSMVRTDELERLRTVAGERTNQNPKLLVVCHCGASLMNVNVLNDVAKVQAVTQISALNRLLPDHQSPACGRAL